MANVKIDDVGKDVYCSNSKKKTTQFFGKNIFSTNESHIDVLKLHYAHPSTLMIFIKLANFFLNLSLNIYNHIHNENKLEKCIGNSNKMSFKFQ